MDPLINKVTNQFKDIKSKYPSFKAGDTINVHVKIKEGAKERIQQYQGTVIQIKNRSTVGETFTVRKISHGVGVERIFPILSPSIDKIELVKKGQVRRARLYYLRNKSGKAARIKEKIVKIDEQKGSEKVTN